MKKKIKKLTVHDFFLFLRDKIVILILTSLLITLISGFYLHKKSNNFWKVNLSRTVDTNELLISIKKIQNKLEQKSTDLKQEKVLPNTIDIIQTINSFIDSSIVNYLSERGINFKLNIVKKLEKEYILKKNYYNLSFSKNEFKERKEIDDFTSNFVDRTNSLLNSLLEIQYGINTKINVIYKFKIENIEETNDYIKILKVMIFSFLSLTVLSFAFHIRKQIILF